MPDSKSNVRNIEGVYKTVLMGTYALLAAISVLSLVSFGLGHKQASGSVAVCGLAALYILAVRWFARRDHRQPTVYLLLMLYMLLATGVVWSWGINTPIGLLLFALVIVLAGMLLKSACAMRAAVMSGLILLGIQTAIVLGLHMPDMAWTGKSSSYGDAAAYCVVFGMLAFLSCLYNREMEHSLTLAKEAGVALSRQKATLNQKVEKRTAQLRQAQLQEMQQMYRFAELGQLGVTLLHDLANHLTTLTLEIEGMQSEQNSKAVARAREITGYLEEIVDAMRARLHGDMQKQTFNIIQKTTEVVNFLSRKAADAKVTIDWHPPARSWRYTGDPTSYAQVIAIIVSNAIDVYKAAPDGQKKHRIGMTMEQDKRHITITISDWGKGIPKHQRKYLFKPFHSTKKTGFGIGLFIAQQTMVLNFKGTVALNPESDHTEFIIKLPVQK